MTTTSPQIFKRLAATGLAFLVALGVFGLLSRSSAPSTQSAPAELPATHPGESTDALISTLQADVRALPHNPQALSALGMAYLQKVRETGDPGYYTRAQGVLATAVADGPHSVDALVGAGTLALARHDFRAGLRYGIAALGVAPERVLAYPVIVDAQVELGRYAAADRTLQRYIDLKPTLAGYARVSYVRELHGDLRGALAAMDLAVSAGGAVPENLAYVQTLAGNLQFDLGRFGAARAAYAFALARFPHYVPASAGLARVAAAEGRLPAAIALWRSVVARLPLPDYVVGLGESEIAAGRVRQGRTDLALVGAEERLLRANGVNTDVDLALFEANHGSVARAVVLGRRAWAAAPSVRSADALGWALTRAGRPADGLAWARRALALGSRDPAFLYHAGMSALAAGRPALARTWLTRALANNPRFSPLYAPRARRALGRLR